MRGLRNNISLLRKTRYLCVNSAPHYLRPPMRGLRHNISLLRKTRYLCVNGTPYHLRPPMRGLRNNISLLRKTRYLCVNSAPHYLRPPMRGHQINVSLLHKSRYWCKNGTQYHFRLMHIQCTALCMSHARILSSTSYTTSYTTKEPRAHGQVVLCVCVYFHKMIYNVEYKWYSNKNLMFVL